MRITTLVLSSAALALALAGSALAVTINVELHGNECHLQPTRVTVVQGTPLTFNVLVTANNTGAQSFAIEGTSVNTGPIAPGESRSVDFTPTRAGSYAYASDLPNNCGDSYRGLLVVQAAPDAENKDAPAPGALLAGLAALGIAIALRRR